jgi:hypothetical protein
MASRSSANGIAISNSMNGDARKRNAGSFSGAIPSVSSTSRYVYSSPQLIHLHLILAIDISTQRCGQCQSRLTPLFSERPASQFQLYMKENMRKVMEDMPGASRADVMKEIGLRWAQEKASTSSLRIDNSGSSS